MSLRSMTRKILIFTTADEQLNSRHNVPGWLINEHK